MEDVEGVAGESTTNVQITPPGWDPTTPPGEGWEWRGKPGSKPGDSNGSWYNPGTGESLHPDLEHPDGIKPHWDYKPGKGKDTIRIDPDTGKPLAPDSSDKQSDTLKPDFGLWVRVGLGVVGAALIIFDIVTVPSGEGSIGVYLLGKAFAAN